MSKPNWVRKEMDDCYYNLDHFYCLRVKKDDYTDLYYVAGFLTNNTIGEDGEIERKLSDYHSDYDKVKDILLNFLSGPKDYVYTSISSD